MLTSYPETVADLGGAPGACPPMAPNFLNFMQFFAKFGNIICWRPPRGLVPPPMGNPGSAPDKLHKDQSVLVRRYYYTVVLVMFKLIDFIDVSASFVNSCY